MNIGDKVRIKNSSIEENKRYRYCKGKTCPMNADYGKEWFLVMDRKVKYDTCQVKIDCIDETWEWIAESHLEKVE